MKKTTVAKIVMMLYGAIIGGSFGIYALQIIDADYTSVPQFLYYLSALIVFYYIAFQIHLMAHEIGHMIFGLLTGYNFVSLRFGKHMFIRQKGKINYKIHSLAGTGGQCLMSPPPYNDGNYPYVLYNLGGIIVNFIISLIFLIIIFVFYTSGLLNIFCEIMVIIGIAVVIMNGIPYQTEYISNDGHNALNIGKDKNTLKGFWTILKTNELMAEGTRLKDIDDEMFEIKQGSDLKNPFSSSILVLKENQLMDRKQFDEASKVIDKLLSDECRVIGASLFPIKLDKLYIDILKNGKDADMSILEDKQTKNYMKNMKNFPSVIRTQYAVSVINGDKDKQEILKQKMNKLKDTYPYTCELESENELIDTIKEKDIL